MKVGDLVKHLGDWAVGVLVIGVIIRTMEHGTYFDVMWPDGNLQITRFDYLELVHEDR